MVAISLVLLVQSSNCSGLREILLQLLVQVLV